MSVKGVQLTERDRQVFLILQRFPLRTAADLHQQCFKGTAFSAAGRRLKKLVDHGLLKRVTLLNDSSFRYYIGEQVREFLQNDNPIKRLNHGQLRHDTELYDCLFELHRTFGEKMKIVPDFELKRFAQKGYRVTKSYKGVIQAFQLSFLPDALLVHGDRNIFLEYDRSTVWGVNLFKKLSAYQEYFATDLPSFVEKMPLDKVQVVFLCQTQSRCDALQAAAKKYTDIDVFRFLTMEEWHKAASIKNLFVS